MNRAVRYYVDEHIAKAVVNGLRQRGVDVCSVAEVDKRGDTDVEHLEWARADGRVIVTHDADFLRLHAAGAQHAGLGHVDANTSVTLLIRRLMLIAQALDADAMANHVEFV